MYIITRNFRENLIFAIFVDNLKMLKYVVRGSNRAKDFDKQ